MMSFRNRAIIVFIGLGFGWVWCPSLWADLPGTEECEEAFRTRSHEARRVMARAMRFGPEVTFVTEAIAMTDTKHLRPVEGIQNSDRTFSPHENDALFGLLREALPAYPEEAFRDLRRFLENVVKYESIRVHFNSQLNNVNRVDIEGTAIHVASTLLHLKLKNHPSAWATIALEPGCIEVNQPPILRYELRSRWKNLFELAGRHDFTGYLGYASGGGGGHMHMSIDSEALGSMQVLPHFVSSLLLYPLVTPGILTQLAGYNDHGSWSNLRTPQDSGAKRIQRWRAFWLFLKRMAAIEANGGAGLYQWSVSQKEGLKSIAAEAGVLDHSSYISLKNFFESPDFRLEFRFARAFNTFEDLEAIVAFIFHLGIMAQVSPIMDVSQLRSRVVPDPYRGLEEERRGFEEFIRSLQSSYGLENRHARRLLRYGGDRLPVQMQVRSVGRGFPRVVGHVELDTESESFSATLRVPLTEDEEEKLRSYRLRSEGRTSRARVDRGDGRSKAIVWVTPPSPFEESLDIVDLRDHEGRVFRSFTLRYFPLADAPTDLSDFRLHVSRTGIEDEVFLLNQVAQKRLRPVFVRKRAQVDGEEFERPGYFLFSKSVLTVEEILGVESESNASTRDDWILVPMNSGIDFVSTSNHWYARFPDGVIERVTGHLGSEFHVTPFKSDFELYF